MIKNLKSRFDALIFAPIEMPSLVLNSKSWSPWRIFIQNSEYQKAKNENKNKTKTFAKKENWQQ